MSADVSCPNCGARNPATAEWCSQCYDPLGAAREPEPTPTPDPAPTPATRVADPTLPTPAPAAPAGTDPVRTTATAPDADLVAGDGRFRTTDGVVEWRCDTCEQWNAVDRLVCGVCGTPMDGGTDRSDTGDLDLDRVRLAAWLVPGGGQWLLGERAKGLSRLLIAFVWLVGALAIVVSAAGSTAALVPVGVLLAGVAVVWVLSAVDVRARLAGHSRELLDDRAFLWVVVGVLGAVIASMVLQAVAT